MSDVPRATAWQRLPPPLLFAAVLIVGILIDRRLPLVRPGPPWSMGLRWLGIALITVGAAHALSSFALFVLSRTTLVPHHRAASFVTSGAYRWTRNPMYLGLVLVYLGVVALTSAVWALVLLALPIYVMNAKIIPMEERSLEDAFGAAYRDYKGRVRRWL
jgi:protein-S-isoprenylcysteine O-methyltransferase Ste14